MYTLYAYLRACPSRALAVAVLVLAATAATAQTQIHEPWVRATVPHQGATGMFARITSAQGARLVEASSPVAGVAEIHEMSMDGDVMRMRAIPALDLPPGRTVELRPGGFHVMLKELRRQLSAGEVVPVTLVIEGRDGRRETLQVQAPVRALGAGQGHGAGHGSEHGRH